MPIISQKPPIYNKRPKTEESKFKKRAPRLYTKSIFLEESQHRALKLVSLQRGVKLNDLLHQVIDAYLTMSSMTDEEKQELLNPHYHL